MNKLFTYLRGFQIRHLKNFTSAKAAFIYAGVASTIWFLIRVIPKPQRAAYPCMQAAAPIMSSFVIWMLSLVGMGAFYKKAKNNFSKSKYVIAGFFVVGFLASAVLFQSQTTQSMFARIFESSPIALAPSGTGKGIFPGRVVWVYNPDAAKWTGTGTYWDAAVNPQNEYDNAFTEGIKSLSGGSDDATSWDLIFKHFNDNHGRVGTGYQSGDKIAIKINQNNTGTSGAGITDINANPQSCVAIVRSLVNAGVPEADIWIGDPSRAVTDNIFNAIHNAYPDVKVVDYFGNNGRVTTTTTANVFTNDYGLANKLSTCFVNARYIVSMPLLKGHEGQNFTFGAKNFFGINGISNNWQNNTHASNSDWEEAFLIHENVGQKVVLWCMDAMYPSPNLYGAPDTKWNEAPFNGKPMSSFIMSLDGVANESVCLDFYAGHYNKANTGEGYITNAAAKGVGVQEHWNNETDKQYTRNLNPSANGIELVYITKPWSGPSAIITTPVSNSPFLVGSTITISGTASTTTGTVTKVEVYNGTTLLGLATGTTNWTYQWVDVPNATSHNITAVATNDLDETGTSSVVTILKPIDLPAKIEAENFVNMNGIQVQATTDAGLGSNIGYTEVGDWLDYLVNVPTTGAYTINFRVASNVATGKIQLRNQAGSTLAYYYQTTTTGGWQAWQTKTVSANLTAGAQTLRIYYTGDGLNINWFEVLKDGSTAIETQTKSDVAMYPNPVDDNLIIEFNGNAYTQLMLFDVAGRLQVSRIIEEAGTSVDIDLTYLKSGIYFIQLKNETKSVIQKIVKN